MAQSGTKFVKRQSDNYSFPSYTLTFSLDFSTVEQSAFVDLNNFVGETVHEISEAIECFGGQKLELTSLNDYTRFYCGLAVCEKQSPVRLKGVHPLQAKLMKVDSLITKRQSVNQSTNQNNSGSGFKKLAMCILRADPSELLITFLYPKKKDKKINNQIISQNPSTQGNSASTSTPSPNTNSNNSNLFQNSNINPNNSTTIQDTNFEVTTPISYLTPFLDLDQFPNSNINPNNSTTIQGTNFEETHWKEMISKFYEPISCLKPPQSLFDLAELPVSEMLQFENSRVKLQSTIPYNTKSKEEFLIKAVNSNFLNQNARIGFLSYKIPERNNIAQEWDTCWWGYTNSSNYSTINPCAPLLSSFYGIRNEYFYKHRLLVVLFFLRKPYQPEIRHGILTYQMETQLSIYFTKRKDKSTSKALFREVESLHFETRNDIETSLNEIKYSMDQYNTIETQDIPQTVSTDSSTTTTTTTSTRGANFPAGQPSTSDSSTTTTTTSTTHSKNASSTISTNKNDSNPSFQSKQIDEHSLDPLVADFMNHLTTGNDDFEELLDECLSKLISFGQIGINPKGVQNGNRNLLHYLATRDFPLSLKSTLWTAKDNLNEEEFVEFVNAKDICGFTPISMANYFENLECEKILKDYMLISSKKEAMKTEDDPDLIASQVYKFPLERTKPRRKRKRELSEILEWDLSMEALPEFPSPKFDLEHSPEAMIVEFPPTFDQDIKRCGFKRSLEFCNHFHLDEYKLLQMQKGERPWKGAAREAYETMIQQTNMNKGKTEVNDQPSNGTSFMQFHPSPRNIHNIYQLLQRPRKQQKKAANTKTTKTPFGLSVDAAPVQSPSGRALQMDSVSPLVSEVGQEFANERQVARQRDFGPSLLFEHCGKTDAH